MTKNYFTDEQLQAIHVEICRLEDLEFGSRSPFCQLNNDELRNLRRICNLAVETVIGEAEIESLNERLAKFDEMNKQKTLNLDIKYDI